MPRDGRESQQSLRTLSSSSSSPSRPGGQAERGTIDDGSSASWESRQQRRGAQSTGDTQSTWDGKKNTQEWEEHDLREAGDARACCHWTIAAGVVMYCYIGVRSVFNLKKGLPFMHAGYGFDVVPERDEPLAYLFIKETLPCSRMFANLTVGSWLSGPVDIPNRCGLGESLSLVVDGYQLITLWGPLVRGEMYSIQSGLGLAVFYASKSEWEAWEAEFRSRIFTVVATFLGVAIPISLCVCWCLFCTARFSLHRGRTDDSLGEREDSQLSAAPRERLEMRSPLAWQQMGLPQADQRGLLGPAHQPAAQGPDPAVPALGQPPGGAPYGQSGDLLEQS